jgi:hypothetical protein
MMTTPIYRCPYCSDSTPTVSTSPRDSTCAVYTYRSCTCHYDGLLDTFEDLGQNQAPDPPPEEHDTSTRGQFDSGAVAHFSRPPFIPQQRGRCHQHRRY